MAVSGTSRTLRDLLDQGTLYYVVIASVNSSGEGLPGTESQVCLVIPGQPSKIGRWNTSTNPPTVLNTLPFNFLTDSGVAVSDIISTYRLPGDEAFRGEGKGILSIRTLADLGSPNSVAHSVARAHGNTFRFVVTPSGPLTLGHLKFYCFDQYGDADSGTAAIWINGSLVYESEVFNGASQLTIDADLSSQGSFTNPITFEVTMAPSNIFSTSLFGANPSDPSTLELTGTLGSSPPPPPPPPTPGGSGNQSKLAASVAGFM